uniref:Uncharacterized protein n=1 Tax=Romanomermis culicivorax TaxID=13658 RepID=A0A915J3K7_ROMCU
MNYHIFEHVKRKGIRNCQLLPYDILRLTRFTFPSMNYLIADLGITQNFTVDFVFPNCIHTRWHGQRNNVTSYFLSKMEKRKASMPY